MSQNLDSHPFWGSRAPLTTLSQAGLFILAGNRLAYALLASLGIISVYTLTCLAALGLKKFMPVKGRNHIILAMASFFGVLYLILLSLLSPIMALEVTFIVYFIPLGVLTSAICLNYDSLALDDGLYEILLDALFLCMIIVVQALIRETLGFGTLSAPGSLGPIEFIRIEGADHFLNQFFASTPGALVLLGYMVAMYKMIKSHTDRG
jgi:hypothetical protein